MPFKLPPLFATYGLPPQEYHRLRAEGFEVMRLAAWPEEHRLGLSPQMYDEMVQRHGGHVELVQHYIRGGRREVYAEPEALPPPPPPPELEPELVDDDGPLDPEERLYVDRLFAMEAAWGAHSKELYALLAVEDELDDLLKKPAPSKKRKRKTEAPQATPAAVAVEEEAVTQPAPELQEHIREPKPPKPRVPKPPKRPLLPHSPGVMRVQLGGAPPQSLVIIDAADAELVSQHNWNLLIVRRRMYVRTFAKVGGKWRNVYLHHLLMGDRPEGTEVIFRNGDTLDLRRENLGVVPRGASRRGSSYKPRVADALAEAND